MAVQPIDLLHQATERIIGVYLLDTEDGPALFDCGPATCVDALEAGLAARGVGLDDIRHLLLSHIHLDHAGAAGVLVRRHPHLQVHVSSVGLPHVVDPTRLEASARRLYGDAFDPLWGELAPVPAENVHAVSDRVLGLDCFATPGHANHHVSVLDRDGTLYAGDAAGVRLVPGPYVIPVSPPPELDPGAWERTIDEIERRAPERLALVHFGVAEDVPGHLGMLRSELRHWVELVGAGMTEDAFVAQARADLAARVGNDADAWQKAAPLWQSYRGLERYWRKRREAAAAAS